MDRKNHTIVTEIKSARRAVDDLKGEQPVGYDTTQLVELSSVDAYDYTVTIPASGTTRLDCDLRFFPLDLEPWQKADYSQVIYQLFVGSPSTKYAGSNATGLAVFTMRMNTSLFVNQARFQINNTSGSARTIYIKFYAISTAPNGTITFTGTLI